MGAHTTHAVHANSVASWRDFDADTRAALVRAVYTLATEPLTDRQVMQRLGFSDMNMVRPSITRLVENGYLVELAKVRDAETARLVRACTTTSLSWAPDAR